MNYRTHGLTLIELLIVVATIGVLASVTVPILLRARMSSNEASAIGSLRTIVSGQADYYALNGAYGNSLDSLSATCAAVPTPFVSNDLETNGVLKNGYAFAVVPGLGGVAGGPDACGTPVSSSYYATGTPVVAGLTGGRGFAADAHLSIWQDVTGGVPAQPFTLTATVSPIGR